jgi:hypothetical protein
MQPGSAVIEVGVTDVIAFHVFNLILFVCPAPLIYLRPSSTLIEVTAKKKGKANKRSGVIGDWLKEDEDEDAADIVI